LEAAERHLQNAERWFDPTQFDPAQSDPTQADSTRAVGALPMRVMDEDEFRSLPAEIASARTYLALAHGDVAATVKYGQRALDLLPADAYVQRGPAASLLGLAYWASGALEAAYQTFADGMAGFQKAGNIAFAISGTYGLADIRIAQGHLCDAVRIYERTLSWAEAQGKPLPQGTAELHLGLAELHHERGDVDASNEQMQQSEALSEQAALPNWPYRRRIVQARIQVSQGALARALALRDEAEPLFVRGPVPDLCPIAALRARVWIRQGKLNEVWDWVHAQGLSMHDELSYLREFEHLTLARLLIAQHEHDRLDDTIHEAIELLTRLLRAAEAGERGGSVIEILALLALARAAKGDMPAALGALERALTLAEPEGYVRLFVEEEAPMARLLAEAQAQRIMPAYVAKLRAAFSVVAEQVAPRGPQTVHVSTGVDQPLIEPLSEREIEVLALVAQGFSNREIAERLFISINTEKGHNRIIFEKLQVQRRTEAVARARELGLV